MSDKRKKGPHQPRSQHGRPGQPGTPQQGGAGFPARPVPVGQSFAAQLFQTPPGQGPRSQWQGQGRQQGQRALTAPRNQGYRQGQPMMYYTPRPPLNRSTAVPDISHILEAFKIRSPSPQETEEVHQLNMYNIRRFDPDLKRILMISSQCGVYKYIFDEETGAARWSETIAAGSLHLYERQGQPSYGMLVMNRLDIENYHRLISSDVEFERNSPYLLVKSGDDILCIWFYKSEDCDQVARIAIQFGNIVELKENSVPAPPSSSMASYYGGGGATSATGSAIFELLNSSAEQKTMKTPVQVQSSPASQPEATLHQAACSSRSLTGNGYVGSMEPEPVAPLQNPNRYAKKTRKLLNRVNGDTIACPTPIKISQPGESRPTQGVVPGYASQLVPDIVPGGPGSDFVSVAAPPLEDTVTSALSPSEYLRNVLKLEPVLSTSLPAKQEVDLSTRLQQNNSTLGLQTIEQLELAETTDRHTGAGFSHPTGPLLKSPAVIQRSAVSEYKLIENALKATLGLTQAPAISQDQSRSSETSGSLSNNEFSSNSSSMSPCIPLTPNADDAMAPVFGVPSQRKTEPIPDWWKTPRFDSPDLLYRTLYPPESPAVQAGSQVLESDSGLAAAAAAVLTKDQLLGSLVHLLKYDTSFGDRVYETYLTSRTNGRAAGKEG